MMTTTNTIIADLQAEIAVLQSTLSSVVEQRDELLALLNKSESLIESLPVQVETIQGGYRLVNDPVPIVRLLSEIKIAIASVKGGA